MPKRRLKTTSERRAGSEPAGPPAPAAGGAWADRILATIGPAAMLAFVIALVAIDLGPHRIGGFDAETDFYGGYAPAAAALAHGRLLTPQGTLPVLFGFVGPLYPAVLALLGCWSGDYFHVAEGMSLVAALLVLVLWGDLLRRRVGPAAGAIGVLLLAANPVLLRQGYWVTTDAMAVALQSLALWLLLGRPERPALLAAGAAAALASLTRYTSVYLLPAGCLAIWMGGVRTPHRWSATLRFVAGFAALALPWVVFARLHGASMQFQQLLAFDVYGTPLDLSWDGFLAQVWPRFEHDPLAVFTTDPAAVATHLLQNLVGHARLDAAQVVGWPVAALAAVGLALVLARRRERALAPVVLCGIWAYLALVPAGHNDRYALAMLPFYAALAAAALAAPLGARAPRAGRALGALLVLVVVTWSLRTSVRMQTAVLQQQPLELLECARTLRALAHPGDRVIARKPHVAWLAGLETTSYPVEDDLDGLGVRARATGARWLFVSAPEVMLRPRTAFLLDTTARVPGLTRRAVSVVPVRLANGLDWWRAGVLYEIGPGLGTLPDWFADDTTRALHGLRGTAAAVPNGDLWVSRASAELAVGDTAAALAAWRVVTRIDPAGAAGLLSRFGGDTLRTLGMRGR